MCRELLTKWTRMAADIWISMRFVSLPFPCNRLTPSQLEAAMHANSFRWRWRSRFSRVLCLVVLDKACTSGGGKREGLPIIPL